MNADKTNLMQGAKRSLPSAAPFRAATVREQLPLERDSQAELNVARVVALAGDRPEARAGRGQVRTGEERLVGQVERFGAELESDTLAELEGLGEREIDVVGVIHAQV